MPDSTVPGDRLREIRLLRGLTQEDLAERSGLSLPTVKKIEQGGSARIETYHALARGLRIRTSQLFEPGDQPSRRDHADDDRIDLLPMRKAVAPALGPGGHLHVETVEIEPDLDQLRATARALDEAYHRDDYVTTSRLLPPLIRSAHTAVAHFDGGPQHVDALRLRSDALQQAGRLLTQIRVYDLAQMALRDAMRDSAAAGDVLAEAAAVDLQGWALVRQARLDEAEGVALATAEAIEPRLSRASRDELAVWGRLLVRASGAAARNNRPAEARDILHVARAAGSALGQRTGGAGYKSGAFNQLSAAYQAIENHMIADRPDRVLGMSERIAAADASTSNTRHRHLLDVARAHVALRQDGDAEDILDALHEESPDWLRHQQMASEVFADLLRKRKRLTGRQRRLAQFFAAA
ncbi:helix-turn-helix domain-containing protein [Streptomyces radicis]|uniref:XRE family transcriptional regulator n=1 Tax=Streptomyces radicis TaxID=1750517 RepID=A0A3A9W7B8_9ACTN|nr:helix-turn-helix transcriptional regulator [Streptomyces radicis]RKN05184.1 XRE family transcriptional regulator [Streptomyces radicis]RKN16717.1 XRE family transcriptional regulator [Streptomyces radicis]